MAFLPLLFFLSLLSTPAISTSTAAAPSICIIGGGITGSSLSFFLSSFSHSPSPPPSLLLFERQPSLAGRTAAVTLAGDTFNAGASIIHGRNLHAVKFVEVLGLEKEEPEGSDWFGIWNGEGFMFKSLKPPSEGSSVILKKLYGILDAFLIFKRYGLSLLRMSRFVENLLVKFSLFYKEQEERPVFESVEEMLKWNDLYALTQRTLEEELIDAGLSSRLIAELVTMITRINYGQSVAMSGLAGAVGLAGSNSDLWAVKGGNFQLAEGLIKLTNTTVHLNEEIELISDQGDFYLLKSNKGSEYNCDVAVVATPLDEVNITILPSVEISSRRMQHTFTTFVRGLLNPKYFGMSSVEDVPNLVGTLEDPNIPFSSVSILRKYSKDDFAYKVFSRAEMNDTLLDQIFSVRKETIKIDWPAYPKYKAPEIFAPFVLDKKHLYYINTFESAASCIETSAVASENVARLIISRLSKSSSENQDIKSMNYVKENEVLHTDL